MKLQVKKAYEDDVYRDTIRIPERHRRDTKGMPIPEGRICRVTVAGRTKLLSIRGLEEETKALLLADEVTRDALGLSLESEVELQADLQGLPGEWRWAWSASDPIVRASVQSNLVSVGLGTLGALLGIVSLAIAFCRPPS
jgi:hypothetical protein